MSLHLTVIDVKFDETICTDSGIPVGAKSQRLINYNMVNKIGLYLLEDKVVTFITVERDPAGLLAVILNKYLLCSCKLEILVVLLVNLPNDFCWHTLDWSEQLQGPMYMYSNVTLSTISVSCPFIQTICTDTELTDVKFTSGAEGAETR